MLEEEQTPRTLGADQAGTPHEFEFEGRTWEIAPMDTIDVTNRFERWCMRRAREMAERLRPSLDELREGEDYHLFAHYREQKQAAEDRINAGYFAWGEEGCVQALSTQAGYREILYLSIRHRCPDFTRAHFERLRADRAKWEEVTALFNDLREPPKPPSPA